MMPHPQLIEKRADQRFSFFADAEITLHDGTSIPTQISELSSRGCYMGATVPLPAGTPFQLRISHNMRTCELRGQVIYVHSAGGLGIFGMGVHIEEIADDERYAIDVWLRDLARKGLAIPSPLS